MKKTMIAAASMLILCICIGCGSVETSEAGMKVAFGEIISYKPLDEGLISIGHACHLSHMTAGTSRLTLRHKHG